jgi:CRISPR-associated protein Csy1
LFPTALVHSLHTTLQEDRFSEAAKEARAARKAGQPHPQGYREYPNMVVQNFGGSKPQNISQLNSERGGVNHLLPSIPPVWQSQGVQPPLRQASVFDKGGLMARDKNLRFWTKTLRKYLVKEQDRNNVHIRNKRAAMAEEIILAVFDLAALVQCLPSGWSQAANCRLGAAEKRWLDASAVLDDSGLPPTVDWDIEVASRFGHWLNAAISTDQTLMGDPEFLEWKHLFLEKLRDET